MSAETGFFRFQSLIVDFAKDHLEPFFRALEKDKVIVQPPNKNFTDVFYGFTDIVATLDTLMLIETLFSLPSRSSKVDKDKYLQFLVGAYLQEVYILEQRLTKYGKKLSRLYKISGLPEKIKQIVYEPLEKIITTRGSHVHQERYTDDDLNVASAYALFSYFNESYAEVMKFEYSRVRRKWKRQIEENNKVTLSIVDQYFDLLFKYICQQGKLVPPLIK
jgi:hypothetical protein